MGVVSKNKKKYISKAIDYFILPFDFIPEALIGPPGYLDDLFMATLALELFLNEGSEDIFEQHWEGDLEITSFVKRVLSSSEELIGTTIRQKIIEKFSE